MFGSLFESLFGFRSKVFFPRYEPEPIVPEVVTFEYEPTALSEIYDSHIAINESLYGPDSPLGTKSIVTETSSQSEIDPVRAEALVSDTFDFWADITAYENYEESYVLVMQPVLRGIGLGTTLDDTYLGTILDDKYFGGAGNDSIWGGVGSDRLHGGDGDDVVKGGSGQDILEGGKGADVLIGGEGIDVFIFRAGDGTTRIEDFTFGFDVLDVEGFSEPTSEAYEALIGFGDQRGSDVYFEIGDDLLILANADLATMVAEDLCIR